MRARPQQIYRRATALIRTDPDGVKTGFVALIISTVAGLVAGVVLGSITGTLVALPGLIVLEPAAIGLRGNVFGALASRLSTMAQLGDLKFTRNWSTRSSQNIIAAIILSLSCSFILAAIAKIVSEAFGIPDVISFSDFFVISIIGGIIPTIIVLVVTIFLARACVKHEWDLDNVGAPIITATGDMMTIPSLVIATLFVKLGWVTPLISVVVSVLAVVLLVRGFYARQEVIKQIIRQSLPVLVVGGSISILAGLTVQGRLSSLDRYPILLVLVPPLLSINGAIGSILSARISTKLHLGIVRSERFAFSPVSEDVTVSYILALPVFIMLGLACALYSNIGHLAGPGFFYTLIVAVIAGVIATTFSNILGYFVSIVSYRFGFDPDNFGVPAVTSGSDLIGAVVFMVTIGVLHI